MDLWDCESSRKPSKSVEEPVLCDVGAEKDDDFQESDVESPEFNAAIRKEVEVAVVGKLLYS